MSGMASSTADASSITARAAGASSTDAGYASADNKRLEERTKCLEQLVHHLLGDVPMDLNNLRRMAEKAGQRAGAGSDDAGAKAGTEDLDDLTLEDENFTVKTLSQSTARKRTCRIRVSSEAHTLTLRTIRLLWRILTLEFLSEAAAKVEPMLGYLRCGHSNHQKRPSHIIKSHAPTAGSKHASQSSRHANYGILASDPAPISKDAGPRRTWLLAAASSVELSGANLFSVCTS